MKQILWTCVEVLMAIIALVIALGALALCGVSIQLAPFIGFLVIILYYFAYKRLGILGFSVAVIIAAIYLAFMFLSTLVEQPLYCLMSCVLSLAAVILMLRGKPLWLWVVVLLFFISIGVYYIFNNDIVGPMGFLIRDRPIDTPAQWYYCYRFYWCGVVAETVSQFAGIVSVIVIAAYILYQKFTSQGL